MDGKEELKDEYMWDAITDRKRKRRKKKRRRQQQQT